MSVLRVYKLYGLTTTTTAATTAATATTGTTTITTTILQLDAVRAGSARGGQLPHWHSQWLSFYSETLLVKTT